MKELGFKPKQALEPMLLPTTGNCPIRFPGEVIWVIDRAELATRVVPKLFKMTCIKCVYPSTYPLSICLSVCICIYLIWHNLICVTSDIYLICVTSNALSAPVHLIFIITRCEYLSSCVKLGKLFNFLQFMPQFPHQLMWGWHYIQNA